MKMFAKGKQAVKREGGTGRLNDPAVRKKGRMAQGGHIKRCKGNPPAKKGSQLMREKTGWK